MADLNPLVDAPQTDANDQDLVRLVQSGSREALELRARACCPRTRSSDGTMAVLSYNLVNYSREKDGTETVGSRWNSTQVYRQAGGQWRMSSPEGRPA